jgi:hypothetical protein
LWAAPVNTAEAIRRALLERRQRLAYRVRPGGREALAIGDEFRQTDLDLA